MSMHVARGGDVAGLLELCVTSEEDAGKDGDGLPVRRHSGRLASTDFGSIACCRMKGSKATSSIRPR